MNIISCNFIFIILLALSFNSFSQNQKLNSMTDRPYIYNTKLPVWIVVTSGWGDEAIEKMEAYRLVAEKWKLNIEFSTRLGTFYSYKKAPTVSKEIQKQNEETFDIFNKEFGNNWQFSFTNEVEEIMMKLHQN